MFTTIWIPLASLKAARWFGTRYQYCPVGRHWTGVVPLDPSSTDPETLERAAAVHDVRVP